MDQISISYVMDNIDSLQRSAAIQIVESQGNCTDLNICLYCPLADECLNKVLRNARFLEKEVRLRKAEDFLFLEALEDDLFG